MGLFRKKSTWNKLIRTFVVKAGLVVLGTLVALSVASAVVSAVRLRQENR